MGSIGILDYDSFLEEDVYVLLIYIHILSRFSRMVRIFITCLFARGMASSLRFLRNFSCSITVMLG